jgi:lipoprotein-releasing system permease protein
MLGVGAMIVTNAVMTGFTEEMQDRIHGVLSDLVVQSNSVDGIPDAEQRMAEIRRIAGEHIAGMSTTVAVPAMLGFSTNGQYITRQVMVVGIDEKTYSSVSDFGQYLQHPSNREQLEFTLRNGGYDIIDHQAKDLGKTKPREEMQVAGWEYRRRKAAVMHAAVNSAPATGPNDPFQSMSPKIEVFDPREQIHTGAVLGIGLCSQRLSDRTDVFSALPGDDLELSFPSAGQPPRVLSAKFTIVDFYESKMGEFDSQFVFVPIRKLQELRGMINPTNGIANFNSIQIRLKDGIDPNLVRDLLQSHFPPRFVSVQTWRDKQSALIAVVHVEIVILNILLSFIIVVAGFGILAIFMLIVIEKTRDIGILKSLGAGGTGISSIFLVYGLILGLVGSGAGLCLGLLFVRYINEIAEFIGNLFGVQVFDPTIYMLPEIPTIVDGWAIALVVLGAIAIAVIASSVPAYRAARLHPVKALRYE